MNTLNLVIAVLIAFAIILMVTIAAGPAFWLTKLVVIPCIFSGTGLLVLLIGDYRDEMIRDSA